MVGPSIISRITTRFAIPALCSIHADEAVHTFLVLLALIVQWACTQYLWLTGFKVIVVRLLWILAELDKRDPLPARPAANILSEDETTNVFQNIGGFMKRIHIFVVL